MMRQTKKVAELGFLLALALILAYVESLIPFSFGIPGIKLGLPNLIVVLLLYHDTMNHAAMHYDSANHVNAGQGVIICSYVQAAFLINILRIVLSGFLFSSLYAILYALAGALFSFAAMMLGRRLRCFSMIGVSVLGGVAHNIGQIIVAMFVVETFYVEYYIPFLIAAGTATGAVLGVAAMELRPYLIRVYPF